MAWRCPVKEKTCFEANQRCGLNGLNLKINWQCSGWAMRANHGCDARAWTGQYWEKMTCKLSWHLTACYFVCQCPVKTHIQKKGFVTELLSNQTFYVNSHWLNWRNNYQVTHVISTSLSKVCTIILFLMPNVSHEIQSQDIGTEGKDKHFPYGAKTQI